MKVALVYTSTTKELIELVEREVRNNLGEDVELVSLTNQEILTMVRDAGYVTKEAAAELISLYMEAVKQGAEAILNICSSVGEVAYIMQDAANFIGVPIVPIDEEMCGEAVRSGTKIAILATLPTTLEPTQNTVLRVARKFGKKVEIVDGLIEGAFGLNQEQFKEKLLCKAKELQKEVDVILLAQGSMAYVEEFISKETGIRTLSSPRFGAMELKKALEKKGFSSTKIGAKLC